MSSRSKTTSWDRPAMMSLRLIVISVRSASPSAGRRILAVFFAAVRVSPPAKASACSTVTFSFSGRTKPPERSPPPHDVDHLGPGHRNHVVGHDQHVFFRIASLHDSLQADFGDLEAARRIVRGALQRYGPPFAAAGDLDGVAGILTRASCQRKDMGYPLDSGDPKM